MAERLPIKLILPKQGAERKVTGGGGEKKPFRTVDPEFRGSLGRQLGAFQESATPELSKVGTAPLRVKLLSKALAKSHRPETLFSESTCPIMGAGQPGELFVKASPKGLNRLSETVAHGASKAVVKELSSVESFEPVTPTYRRQGQTALEILQKSPRGKKGFLTRVQLFDFGEDQERHINDFNALCEQRKIKVRAGAYAPDSFTFEAECTNAEDVELLASSVSVRNVSNMPVLETVVTSAFDRKPLPANLPSPADTNGDYPVVVVVDSGIGKDLPALVEWVIGRDTKVSPQYANTTHGTFVAGLIVWGGELNPHLAGINSDPVGVFDLHVMPNRDPSKGPVDKMTEVDLLEALEGALKQHAHRFKVWNLSLNAKTPCSLSEFSPLAISLDNLQEKYQVSFVISAGNYDIPPLLDYPRSGKQLTEGRITSPADSVLGIAVGSLSHLDYQKNGPKKDHPSAFSRHGAGPNHVIKPDLVQYGGTCTTDTAHANGVRSIFGDKTAEDIGTSYSTPLVSRTLAQIYHQVTPTPSPVLARALLTHHARDPRTRSRVPDGEENYFGFGLPEAVPYCLECTNHSATLVFEDTLRPGFYQEWRDFPYPPSLYKNGRYFGEVWMTIAFAPARGNKWGTEYCETHVEAHFGVYFGQKSQKTGKITRKFRGLVPPEHKNPGLLFEEYQIENLRKWAPVRTYHGDMGPNGERGDQWRLKVNLLTRHGIENEQIFKAQPFALIVTIADPEKKAKVYDEISQILRTRYKAENLAVRAATRIQAKSK
jgi:serine protease AprX